MPWSKSPKLLSIAQKKTGQTFIFADFFQNKVSPESTSFSFSVAKVLSASSSAPNEHGGREEWAVI